VRLVKAFETPFANVVAHRPDLLFQQRIVSDEPGEERWEGLAKDLYQRDTTPPSTRPVQFAMENVSRQLIWSFLHSHPFYNSEQVANATSE